MAESWVENLRAKARRYAYGGADSHRMYVTMPIETKQSLRKVSEITGILMGIIIGLAVEDLIYLLTLKETE